VHAWSPRIDRAWLVRGLISILELVRGRFGYMSVAFGQSVFSGSIEIWTIFYCKAVRKDIFTKITFRKNGYADFYGLSGIDSVVTDFDPNTYRVSPAWYGPGVLQMVVSERVSDHAHKPQHFSNVFIESK